MEVHGVKTEENREEAHQALKLGDEVTIGS